MKTVVAGVVIASAMLFPVDAFAGETWDLTTARPSSADVRRYETTSGILIDHMVADGIVTTLHPRNLARRSDGELLVADVAAIHKFDAVTGQHHGELVLAGASPGNIRDMLCRNGLLYLAVSASNGSASAVRRYNPFNGEFVDVFVAVNSGGLISPTAMTFLPDGSLAVASFGTDEILRYDGDTGAFLGAFASGGDLNDPVAMVLRSDGVLLVAIRAQMNIVLKYNGTTGEFLGQLTTVAPIVPNGLAIDPDMTTLFMSGEGHSGAAPVVKFDVCSGAYLGSALAGDSELKSEAVEDMLFLESQSCSTSDCSGDVNGDGVVDSVDLGILLGHWGVCP